MQAKNNFYFYTFLFIDLRMTILMIVIFLLDDTHFKNLLISKNLSVELMSAIYILIGLSLLAALSFLAAFFWAIKTGQYDDDYTPSVRMLFDDETHISEGVEVAGEKTEEIEKSE